MGDARAFSMMVTHSSSACVECEHIGWPSRASGMRSSTTTFRSTPLACSLTTYFPAGL